MELDYEKFIPNMLIRNKAIKNETDIMYIENNYTQNLKHELYKKIYDTNIVCSKDSNNVSEKMCGILEEWCDEKCQKNGGIEKTYNHLVSAITVETSAFLCKQGYKPHDDFIPFGDSIIIPDKSRLDENFVLDTMENSSSSVLRNSGFNPDPIPARIKGYANMKTKKLDDRYNSCENILNAQSTHFRYLP